MSRDDERIGDEKKTMFMIPMYKRWTCFNYRNGRCRHEDAEDLETSDDFCVGYLGDRPSWCPLVELVREFVIDNNREAWVEK